MQNRNDGHFDARLPALALLVAALFVSHSAAVQAQSVTVTATAQTLCGDSIVQPPEQCDGANLDGESCSSLGYTAGTLSCASNCVFVTNLCTNPPPAGGGGGGIRFDLDDLRMSVIVSGRAYPFATIVISEGSTIRASFSAAATANFQTTLITTAGLHSYTVYGVDKNGRRSLQYPFRVTVNPNIVNAVTGIFLPPTIGLDRTALKKGATLGIVGLTVPQGVMFLYVDALEQGSASAAARGDGTYSLSLNTFSLGIGSHEVRTRVTSPGDLVTSDLSQALSFTIEGQGGCKKEVGDLNCDGGIDIADLSSLLYWWETASSQGLATADLNQDGRVGLVDLSIMLANWTD